MLAGRSRWAIAQGDVLARLAELPDESVNCVVTSPPYWGLRDYGVTGQIGLEPTPDAYVARMVAVFAAVRRVLRSDGVAWVNLGDSYAANRTYQVPSTKGGPKHSPAQGFEGSAMSVPEGLKPKDLVGIPWRVAFALQADGWWLRSDVIWAKPNPMPESVTDRPTRAHEYLFLLTKSARYWYDADAIKEPNSDGAVERFGKNPTLTPNTKYAGLDGQSAAAAAAYMPEWLPNGRNKRTVWTIATEPYPDAHFATFPTALVEPCVLAGCPVGGVVLDPFAGSGTTLLVALRHGRRALGIELNPTYVEMAERRIVGDCPMFNSEAAS